jgi:AcrR family transcriptional regulator
MPKETFFNLPAEKRQRIVSAAMDQVAEHHYDKVTIDRIVEAAGIPKGSFYQYFENKDDLYVYLFTEVGDTKLTMIERLIAQVSVLSFRDFMLAYISQLKQLEAGDARMAQLKQEFLNQCPQHVKRQILKSEMPKYMRRFQRVIEAYINKGEFRPGLDSKVATYVAVMSISSLEHYDYAEKEDMLSVLLRTIDFLSLSMG